MKPINKLHSRLQRTALGWTELWISLPFIGAGSYFALAGLGLLPLPGKANAPLWVIGAVGLVFALGGMMLLVQATAGLWERRRRAGLDGVQRQLPWVADYPWNPAGIGDRAYLRPLRALAGTLMLGLILLPFNWWAFYNEAGPLAVQIVVGLMDLGFSLTLLHFLYRLAQYLKYGSSELALLRFPAAPGEPLELQYHGPMPGPLKATLRFIEERLENGGRRQSLRCYEHYSASQTLTPTPGAGTLPIRFQLPQNPEWVTRLTPDPGVRYWELLLEAKAPGIDFSTRFPLPVYRRSRGQAQRPPPRPPARARRRFAFPYAFEIGLPLALFGLLWLALVLAPETSRRFADAGLQLWRQQTAAWRLHPVTGIGSSAMAARTGPDGRIWVLTKYSLDRFDRGQRENLLNPQHYRERFEHKMNALSSLLVTGPDEAWVGSWYGELFHYRSGEWRQLTLRGEPIEARIYGMVPDAGGLLLASARGLWRWADLEQRLFPLEGLPSERVEAIALAPGGEICAGIGSRLWCHPGSGWRLRWQAPGPILALAPLNAGAWLLGTHRGFYRLDAKAEPGPVQLPGQWITGFQRDGAALWVGTWRGGLFRRQGERWQSYPVDDISELTLDQEGGLWLAVYSQGLLHIPRRTVAGLLR